MDQTTPAGRAAGTPERTAPGPRAAMAAPIPPVRWLWWGAIWLAVFILLAHTILVAGGRWDGDEFFNFTQYRQSGIAYLLFRTLHWSPRPVSEFVLYLYALAVLHWDAPLITPFLGLLWGVLIGGTFAAAWWGGIGGRLPRLGLGLTVAAMFLLGHQINEMFFWPMAAAPYLLALPALVVAVFAIIGGHTQRMAGRWIAAAALSIAVLSAETGLFMAVAFAAVLWVVEGRRIRDGLRGIAGAAWYLLPLVLSFGILICEFSFRVGDATTGIGPTQAYFHRVLPSLGAALLTTPHELLLYDRSANGMSSTGSLAVEVLLLAGFYFASVAAGFRRAPWQHLAALAVALPGAVGLIVFASYYQYGAWGFERHRTFGQCLDLLWLLVLARTAAQWTPPMPRLVPLGAACLAAALAIAGVVRLPAILHDAALLPDIRKARDMTWDSGNDLATTTLRYTLPPGGRVLEPSVWQTGHFSLEPRSPGMPWYVPGVLAFFGKKAIDIVPYQAR